MATPSNKISLPANLQFFLVDDQEQVLTKMRADLISAGFPSNQIATSLDIPNAIAITQNRVFDVILCDYNLGDRNGFELLKSVKSDPKNVKTAFIMVTAMNDVSFMLEAIKLGAHQYIVKPWEKSELFRKISSAIEMCEKRKA